MNSVLMRGNFLLYSVPLLLSSIRTFVLSQSNSSSLPSCDSFQNIRANDDVSSESWCYPFTQRYSCFCKYFVTDGSMSSRSLYSPQLTVAELVGVRSMSCRILVLYSFGLLWISRKSASLLLRKRLSSSLNYALPFLSALLAGYPPSLDMHHMPQNDAFSLLFF